MEAIPGYLSLHQNADIMTLKWTPNQLMNGSVGDLDYERRCETIRLQTDCDYGNCVCLQSPLILKMSCNVLPQRHVNTLHYFFTCSRCCLRNAQLLLNNAACLCVAQGLSMQLI